MMQKIPHNNTIADIVGSLSKPEEYVRGVVGHLSECHIETGRNGAYVRIGITGRGIVPNYRIEMPPLDEGSGYMPTWKAFRGSNHKILVDENILTDENWSNKSMSYHETRTLLGQIRSQKHA